MNPLIRWRTDWVSEEDAVRQISSSGDEEDMYYARQTIYFLLMGVVEEIEEERSAERSET